MSKPKQLTFLLVGLFASTLLAVHGYVEANNSVNLIPVSQNGRGPLDHSGFPQTKLTFFVKEIDDKFFRAQLTQSNFTVYEDDLPLDLNYNSTPIGVHISVLMLFNSWDQQQYSHGDHRAILEEVADTANSKDVLELCFILTSWDCRPTQNLKTEFDTAIQQKRQNRPGADPDLGRQYALIAAIINSVAQTSKESHTIPFLILVTDSSSFTTIPSMDDPTTIELQDALRALARVDGRLILVEKPSLQVSSDTSFQNDFTRVFGIPLVVQFMSQGVIHPDSNCHEVWQACFVRELESFRPILHTIQFNSHLLHDNRTHYLRVELVDSKSSIHGDVEIDFQLPRKGSSQISSFVYWFQQLFAILVIVLLFVTLVVVNEPDRSES